MYFPDPAFLHFLCDIDSSLKEAVSIDGFQQEGDNLIKVEYSLCLSKLFAPLQVAHERILRDET